MAKQTFTTGQVLTAAQMNSLQSNDFNQTVSVKTAAYTLVAADKGTRIEFNTSGGVTCTVNTGLFDAGDTVVIQNRGAGDVTVTAGTATVNTAGSLVISQYQSATLYFISASASILFAGASGDVTGVTSGTGISISNAGGPVPTITNAMATEITAKGDLIVGTGNATFDNLAVGTNGHTLVADSSTSTGLKWAAPSAGGFVGAQLTKDATQSIANGDYYAVTWPTEAFDTDSFHDNSTNNSRVTIPSGKSGYYRFSGIMTFASNSTGSRLVRIHKNGSNIVWVGWLAGLAGGNETGVVFCHTLNATAGDYFELFVRQNSGDALNVTISASWDVQYLGA